MTTDKSSVPSWQRVFCGAMALSVLFTLPMTLWAFATSEPKSYYWLGMASVLAYGAYLFGYAAIAGKTPFKGRYDGAINRAISIAYAGHEIQVTNHWFFGAKLLIDGGTRATTREPFAIDKNIPRLTTMLESDGHLHKVEVFAWAPVWKVHLKVCVDGKMIGGDSF